MCGATGGVVHGFVWEEYEDIGGGVGKLGRVRVSLWKWWR